MIVNLALTGTPCLCSKRCTTRTTRAARSNQPWLRAVGQARQVCRPVGQAVLASLQEESPQVATEQNQISAELMKQMEASISEALHAEKVVVQDVYGDGRHVSIEVVSAEFEGQSSVKRQRLVYKAIWQELQDTVHAVDAMVTKTPAEISS